MYGLKNGLGVELPERYIINENACILFWKDGTKTIVKKAEDDEFNPRIAYLTAFFQRYCGLSKNKANKLLANLQTETEVKPKIKSKFKVGDKVKIRKDLVSGTRYGNESYAEPMNEFLGKEVTIAKIKGNGKYLIVEDYEYWTWTDEMFEKE